MATPILTRCPECQAKLESHGGRFCAYCGAALPRPVEAVLTGEEHRLRRFERLAEHPDLPRLMELTPSTRSIAIGGGLMSAFGVVFTCVAVFILGGFRMAGAPGFLALFPLLFVGAGIFIVVKGATTASRVTSAPWSRVLARVADERVRVSGGGKNSSASTSYFVSLEDEHGHREEYPTSAEVAGKVALDDLGVAYLKAGMLIDFRRVRV